MSWFHFYLFIFGVFFLSSSIKEVSGGVGQISERGARDLSSLWSWAPSFIRPTNYNQQKQQQQQQREGDLHLQASNRRSNFIDVGSDHQHKKNLAENSKQLNTRQSRFLSLFTLVQFNNQDCVGATGDNGTCLAASECAQRGGTPNGPCANGFGSCCMFFATCGGTIRDNGTFFVHSTYPQPYDQTGSCQVSIMKQNPSVCQYRLDFYQMSLMGPEQENNICNNDQFIASGGSPVPVICGTNDGNHMYIDAGSGTSPVTISIVTSGPSFRRSWRIKITQIPCPSTYKADDGCLQYYTGVSGQIRSFNYEPNIGLQLSNQDYSICIRNERSFCAIQYSQCPDVGANNRSQSFTLSGNNLNPQGIPAIVGSTGNAGNICQNDYLVIPMASNVGRTTTGVVQNVDRICGGTLSADPTLTPTTIRSTVRPFRLWFHTDGVEATQDIANRGFCLNYVQQPCTNSLI